MEGEGKSKRGGVSHTKHPSLSSSSPSSMPPSWWLLSDWLSSTQQQQHEDESSSPSSSSQHAHPHAHPLPLRKMNYSMSNASLYTHGALAEKEEAEGKGAGTTCQRVATQFIHSLTWASVLQRSLGILAIFSLYLATFGPAYMPFTFGFSFLVAHIMLAYFQARSAYSCYMARRAVREYSTTDWLLKYCQYTGTASGSDIRHDLPYDNVKHVIILPNYKESMETLCETLDVLASHTMAISNYKICLAMEESEAEGVIKANALIRMYTDHFYEIIYTIHPVGLPGEIRGKSSNVSWASKECVAQEHDLSCCVFTVMDADTCFSQDYFSAISFYYATASPQQRKVMMFVPPTIFDRNSKNVPGIVRMTDLCWSAAAMSNMYSGSPITFPCSAYSVSMDLVEHVGYWDASPEAIGEDMHMYLKCLFRTQGRLIVKTVFSPASQCNIEGSNYLNGILARYTQGKRHIWGCLDTPYAVRHAAHNFWHGFILKQEKFIGFSQLFQLFVRLFEAHFVLGMLCLFLNSSSLLLAADGTSTSVWNSLFDISPHPALQTFTYACSVIRVFATICTVLAFVNYEWYHQWVSTDRWVLKVDPDSNILIQPLGRRPHLHSSRSWLNILEYAYLPLCAIPFQVVPQYVAHISQLWTNRLDYQVAAKPSLSGKLSSSALSSLCATPGSMSTSVSYSSLPPMVHDMGERLAASNSCDDINADAKSILSISSRGDSAFYEYENDTNIKKM